MLNITREELDKMFADSAQKLEGLRNELYTIQLEINQLGTRQNETNKKIKDEEKRLEAIREAQVLNDPIPEKVSGVRKRLLTKIERSKREEITIAEKKKMDAEIPELKMELQKECTHPFVFHRDGYEGSPSQDFENSYPGHRYCIVCGFHEDSYDSRETGALGLQREYLFKLLTTNDNRIIKREPYRPYPESQRCIDIWMPLGAAIKPFEESIARTLSS